VELKFNSVFHGGEGEKWPLGVKWYYSASKTSRFFGPELLVSEFPKGTVPEKNGF
jgi:hypothetical protein